VRHLNISFKIAQNSKGKVDLGERPISLKVRRTWKGVMGCQIFSMLKILACFAPSTRDISERTEHVQNEEVRAVYLYLK